MSNPNHAEGAAPAAPAFAATFRVRVPGGLHFRPAARIAHRLGREAPGATVEIGGRGRTANARSVLAVVGLGLRVSLDYQGDFRTGDEVTVRATGPGAERAVLIVGEVVGGGGFSHEDLLRELPDGGEAVFGEDLQKVFLYQVELERNRERLRDEEEEFRRWTAPGGFLHELADDTAPWVLGDGDE